MPNLFQKAELKKSTQVTIQLSEYITGCQHYVANSGTKEEQEEEEEEEIHLLKKTAYIQWKNN